MLLTRHDDDRIWYPPEEIVAELTEEEMAVVANRSLFPRRTAISSECHGLHVTNEKMMAASPRVIRLLHKDAMRAEVEEDVRMKQCCDVV